MKIAIIGSGISGLSAAYLLQPHHDITVYEKNAYIGGHSRTLSVDYDGINIPVDTGFIVFNDRNYPLLTDLFNHLNVTVENSDMSFAVSINQGWFEYGTQTIANVFAQKTNLLKPQFWRTIWDIKRFFRNAPKLLEQQEPTLTIGEYLELNNYSSWFKEYFLLPMGGAIWSSSTKDIMDFPARSFIQFFANHGLLATSGQPQWKTVSGGSKNYVEKLIQSFQDRIKLNHSIQGIKRINNKVEITEQDGSKALYDEVVLACHSDQAIALLKDATEHERTLLGAIGYRDNIAYLHRDTALMPKRNTCWASWVYLSEQQRDSEPHIAVSYWMNRLQNIDVSKPLIVTLNPSTPPKEHLVFNRHVFEHPVFDKPAMLAQQHIEKIQGENHTWFAGAYLGYGFHEDGIRSGVNVAKALGAPLPWQKGEI